MSLTAKTWAAESGHWYTRDGVPAYTTIGVNGRERYTTPGGEAAVIVTVEHHHAT